MDSKHAVRIQKKKLEVLGNCLLYNNLFKM